MNGEQALYDLLEKIDIPFEYYEHPEAPTVEIALHFWRGIEATKCKNIFLRNHKGDKHYLVVLECSHHVVMKDLEQRLKQGKLSFASPERLYKYLGVKPGSVTPLGLIHDVTKNVHLFLDKSLLQASKLSFHPNVNTASLVITHEDFVKFLTYLGVSYQWVQLYD